VHLTHNYHLTDVVLSHLGNYCGNISELNIQDSHNMVTTENMTTLVTGCVYLRHINLRNTGIHNEGLTVLLANKDSVLYEVNILHCFNLTLSCVHSLLLIAYKRSLCVVHLQVKDGASSAAIDKVIAACPFLVVKSN
jgi:hypothetical protein